MIIALILSIQIDTIKPIKITPLPVILPKMVVADSVKKKTKKLVAARVTPIVNL
jgi:hypothetical protein